jgi:hypothetical protein
MEYQGKIISRLADRQCKWICEKTIGFLQKMTEGMQSGDDSPLKNLWDEICVQVQSQESMLWDFYLDYMQKIIWNQLKKLDLITRYAIWLQTEAGEEFLLDFEEYEEYGSTVDTLEYLYDKHDILNHILNNYVLREAANATNARIEKYLEYR